MRVLADTHAFLWYIYDDPRLPKKVVELFEDEETRSIISLVSVWEIAIKNQIGKLRLGMEFRAFLDNYIEGTDIEVLALESAHLLTYSELPLHHRDPFDRMLIAQSLYEQLEIVTGDEVFRRYPVDIVW